MATQTVQSMISETSICNQALGLIGVKAITSLNDPGATANLCRNQYPFIRDEVLERRFWSFARAREVSQSATKGEWGDEVQHRLPPEWIKVYKVFDSATADLFSDIQIEWTLEGENVMCCEETVYMWGTQRITDTGKFPNLFTQCLVNRLASEFAVPLKGSTKKQITHFQIFENLLSEAATSDGQQGKNFKIKSGSLVKARRYGGSHGQF